MWLVVIIDGPCATSYKKGEQSNCTVHILARRNVNRLGNVMRICRPHGKCQGRTSLDPILRFPIWGRVVSVSLSTRDSHL